MLKPKKVETAPDWLLEIQIRATIEDTTTMIEYFSNSIVKGPIVDCIYRVYMVDNADEQTVAMINVSQCSDGSFYLKVEDTRTTNKKEIYDNYFIEIAGLCDSVACTDGWHAVYESSSRLLADYFTQPIVSSMPATLFIGPQPNSLMKIENVLKKVQPTRAYPETDYTDAFSADEIVS